MKQNISDHGEEQEKQEQQELVGLETPTTNIIIHLVQTHHPTKLAQEARKTL